MRFGDFCNVKDQYDFISTLAFLASRRACRPTAVFPSQLTRSCTTPASREARRRAAVTPQPSRMSPYAPVRLRRAVRKGLSPRAAVTPQSICFPSSTPAPYGRGVGCRGSPPAAQSGVKGYYPLLEEDTDHAAVAFVDDLAEGLLHFFLSVHGHAHQLVGKALPHQFV